MCNTLNGQILGCWPKKELWTFSFLWYWRPSKTRGTNSISDGSICCLLDVCHVVGMVTVEESLPLFTTFKIFTIYAPTVLRAENVGLEALTILFEAPWFLAMASLTVLSQHQNFTSLLLCKLNALNFNLTACQEELNINKEQLKLYKALAITPACA